MSSDIPLNLILHENQKLIHDSLAMNKVVKAGKRFGKTKWALFELCQAAGRTPGGVFWYIAPYSEQARNIAWDELVRILDPVRIDGRPVIKRKPEHLLFVELTNGAKIQLIGADNEKSLRGPKLAGVVFDEAAYIKDYVWPGIVSGQLMGSKHEKQGFAYFISSPNKEGRNWFTNFHSEAGQRKLRGEKWDAWKFTINDNPLYSAEQIQELRRTVTDHVWQLEYLAEESEYAGIIFSEFKDEHIGDVTLDENWLLARGIDWGINHPTTCLWVYYNPLMKRVYVADEFLRSGFLIRESCDAIKHQTGGRAVQWTVIDPSTNKRNSQTGLTDMVEFARWGVSCVPGDNRDRGYDISKMFFKMGMTKISPRCKNLILQLKTLQYGDKEGDDLTDPMRYAFLRIHDHIFGMNIFDHVEQPFIPSSRNEYSFFDTRLFPKKELDRKNWILEEVA